MAVKTERILYPRYQNWLTGLEAKLTKPDLRPSELGAAPYAVEVRVLQNICNSSCISCIGQNEGGRKIIANPDMVRAFIKEASENGVSQIDFSGPNSEPSLHPDFDSFLKTTADSGLSLGVFTNATRLPLSTISILADCANYVLVNLAASNPNMYEKIYGTKFFDPALDNLKKLAAESKKHQDRREHKIAVNYTLTSRNSTEKAIRAMLNLFSSIGADSLNVVWPFSFLYITPTPDREAELRPQLSQAEIEAIVKEAGESGLNIFFTAQREDKRKQLSRFCWAQFQRLVLDPDGSLLACRSTYSTESGSNGLRIGLYDPGNLSGLLSDPARDSEATCGKCQPLDQKFNKRINEIFDLF